MKRKSTNIEIIGSQKDGLTQQEEKSLNEYFKKKKRERESKIEMVK